MEIKDKIIYFENDDEFFDYAVIPQLIGIKYLDDNGNEKYYYDFELSSQYNNAVNNDYIFIIKDENSKIYKRRYVTYHTISKEIKNLEPWFNNINIYE